MTSISTAEYTLMIRKEEHIKNSVNQYLPTNMISDRELTRKKTFAYTDA